jgi:hypothetical protein
LRALLRRWLWAQEPPKDDIPGAVIAGVATVAGGVVALASLALELAEPAPEAGAITRLRDSPAGRQSLLGNGPCDGPGGEQVSSRQVWIT